MNRGIKPLEEKIARLEQEARRLRRGTLLVLLFLVLLMLLGQVSSEPSVIEVEQIRILDHDGNVRASLGTSPDGATGLTLRDPDGASLAVFRVEPEKGPRLLMEHGAYTADLDVDSHQGAILELLAGEQRRVRLDTGNEGNPYMYITSGNAWAGFMIPFNEEGFSAPRMELHEGNRGPRLEATAGDEGVWLRMWDQNFARRISVGSEISTGQSGRLIPPGDLRLEWSIKQQNAKGEVVWSAP